MRLLLIAMTTLCFAVCTQAQFSEEELAKYITPAVENFAKEFAQEPIQVTIGKIVYDKELYGPFSAKLKNALQKVIRGTANLKLHATRGIKIKKRPSVRPQIYAITAKYNRNAILISLEDPMGKIIADKKVSLPVALKKQDIVPANFSKIKAYMQAFQQTSAESKNSSVNAGFSLEFATDRGENATYRHGEKLLLHLKTSADCYVDIYYVQANGENIQIFPNAYHQDNYIKGGQLCTIPDHNYEFDLEIDCSEIAGTEFIKAFASRKKLPILSGVGLGAGLRGIKVKPKKMMKTFREKKNVVEAMVTIFTTE